MPATTLAHPAPRPDADGPAAELERDARALHSAMSELVRLYQFRDRDRICCHDISVTQCYALEALHRHGPLRLGELATDLYVEKSTASRAVQDLERKGYVSRSPHPADGRAIRLEITPAGVDLYRRIDGQLVHEMKRLLADFDPDVRTATTRLFGRLTRAAAERLGDGASCAT